MFPKNKNAYFLTYYLSFNVMLFSLALISQWLLHVLQNVYHDDVIKWKYFPCYWRLVRESTGGFPSQRLVTQSFDGFFDLGLNKQLSKHGDARDLRHHRTDYDATVMHSVWVAIFGSSHGMFIQHQAITRSRAESLSNRWLSARLH